MNLFTAIVSLPHSSHSEHAVIDKGMRILNGKIIILEKMKSDPDYNYKSSHNKTHDLWWWHKDWLQDIKPLINSSNASSILHMDDCGDNGIISGEAERSSLAKALEFIGEHYKYSAKHKRFDPIKLTQEMMKKSNIGFDIEIMRKAIKVYGYKSMRVNL